MYSVYSFLLSLWLLASSPKIIFSALTGNNILPGILQRFGKLPQSVKHDGRFTVWMHACSVGETLSVQPLAEQLLQKFPEARIVFSTVTKTGQQIAIDRFGAFGKGCTFYFPFDFASIISRVINWIKPQLIITVDTEIWPNLLREAQIRNIPIVMVNGRISSGAFKYYRAVRPLMARILTNYSLLIMKSKEDSDRVLALGAEPRKIVVSGNIKFDRNAVEGSGDKESWSDLNKILNMNKSSAPLIVAGSTHEGEESIILSAFEKIRKIPKVAETRLLIAPRHPIRFDQVAKKILDRGYRLRRRSDTNEVDDWDVFLLDSVGELAGAYQYSSVVFVGGSLIPHGGHSIMEPALFAKPIIVGPYTKNFQAVITDFKANNALIELEVDKVNLQGQIQRMTDALRNLLLSTTERERMGNAGRLIVQENQGATAFTLDRIIELIALQYPSAEYQSREAIA